MTNWRIWLSAGLLWFAASSVVCAQANPDRSTQPYGLTARTYWTTSNFRGRPEPPPPYRAEPAFPQLKFKHTTLLAHEPSLDRFFVGEREGKIYVLPKDRQAAQAAVFFDARSAVERLNKELPAEQQLTLDSLYGLTFDPDFAANRTCYVCYVVKYRNKDLGQHPDGTRVVRLRVSNSEPPVCEPESEQLVIAWLEGGHNGGCLKFGPDGCLYISSGDGGFAFPPDGRKSGQDMSTLLAKIMRIDVRRGDGTRPYTIPTDNPFAQLDGARGEIWAYGVRNPWKMSFDRQTGELWVGDVGWELWELVYNVRRGDNYGWSIVEGSQPVHVEGKRGPTPIVPATMEIPHTEGASITGGFVYRGKQFPELVGQYVFGDWETRRIWGSKVTEGKLGERVELIDATVRIVDFAEDSVGELYLLDYEDGTIYTLARNVVTQQENPFPRKLSDTGIFRSTAKHEPAPGVLPFSINAEQWSDHAVAERLIGVPGRESIRIRPKATAVPGSQFSRATDFPKDTVLAKTLSLEMIAGEASSRRRIETQVLHYDGREWLGYSYEWNADQTEATLVERNGKNRTLEVRDAHAPGGKRSQTWRYSARAECIRCHNPWSEHTLAFNLPQLNRQHDFRTSTAGGDVDNQLRTLRHIGLIENDTTPDPNDPTLKPVSFDSNELPRLSPLLDESLPLDARARSYLHVNCSHCHRFNGGGSSYIYLPYDLKLRDTKAIGVRPTQGTFGIHEAQLIAPGDPYRSVLYFRLAKLGPGHMPHLGAKLVDERALGVLHDWIRQLPARFDDQQLLERLVELDEPAMLAKERDDRPRLEWRAAKGIARGAKRDEPNDTDRAAAQRQIDSEFAANVAKRVDERRKLATELLTTPARGALVAEAIRRDRLPAAIRQLLLDTALAANVDPAIRDLFEAFVPEEQRTKRLGDTIDAAELLKLTGDANRGRALWHESTVVQCRNCHQIGGKGTELGPALDAIGKKLDRAKLLESIMLPSLQIEPKYAMWLVETKSGMVVTGLMVRQNDAEIVLRDAQNKPHRVAAADIEGVFPQQKSIMPEMQLREFTAQQVADLLAYLSTLRGEPAK